MQAALGIAFLIVVIGAFAAAIVRPWLAFVLIVSFPVIEPVSYTHLTLPTNREV